MGDDTTGKKDEENSSNRLNSIERSEKAKTFNLRSKSHTKLHFNETSREKDKDKDKERPGNNGKLSKF